MSELPAAVAADLLFAEIESPRKNPDTIPMNVLSMIVKKRLCDATLKRISTRAIVAMFSKANISAKTKKQMERIK